MFNKIWFGMNLVKAAVKDAFGLKLSPWESFVLEIGP